MSIELMNIAWELPLPPTEKWVLVTLADNASQEGHCFPRISTLVRRTSLDERTVQRMLTRLEEQGHITRHMRPGRSTIYTVHPRQPATPDSKEVPPAQRHPRQNDTTGGTSPTPGTVPPYPRRTATHNPQLTTKESKNPPSPPAAQAGKVKKTRSAREESDGFKELKAIYPKRAGSQRYDDANKFYEQRLAEGHTHDVMKDGIVRYTKLQIHEGNIGTAHVMQMATFLGPNRAFLEAHDIPVEQKKEDPKTRAIRERREAALEISRQAVVHQVELRPIFNGETLDDYRKALQDAIELKRRMDSGEVKQRSLHNMVGALRDMPKNTEK